MTAPCVIVVDLLLDEHGGLEFIGKPGSLGEFGIDFAEIHETQIKLRELVEGKTFALLVLGLVPWFWKLFATLFLQDARELTLKAAIGFLLGQADTEELLRTIGPDIGT